MQKNGRVYWITGLSGAGKTTIGRLWYRELKEKQDNVVLLDGDQLRMVFGGGLGYSGSDRYQLASSYGRLCAMLSRQGMDVVCCTISMFDAVREWNRSNIPDYVEIYLHVTMDTLYHRDQKGLYTRSVQNVAGLSLQVEEPKHPDLILHNDGEKTPEEQVALLRSWDKAHRPE